MPLCLIVVGVEHLNRLGRHLLNHGIVPNTVLVAVPLHVESRTHQHLADEPFAGLLLGERTELVVEELGPDAELEDLRSPSLYRQRRVRGCY